MTVFALLDDANADAMHPSSRLYTDFIHEHRCEDPAALGAVWAAVDRELRGEDGPALHAVLLADYEWGATLMGAGRRSGEVGALRVLMFRTLRRLDAEGVSHWLAQAEGADEPGPAGVRGWRAEVDEAGFSAAVQQIQDWIRAGETYQVNYTYRLRGEAWGSPLALYRRLRRRQPVPYGALIALPPSSSSSGAVDQAAAAADAGRWVLSCSPELFVRHAAGVLTTRPMKGTAPLTGVASVDTATAAWLADDVKNRAENLMIVDLLRNDLGRIARTGSVRVPQRFALEPYGTVLQMTSTVQADLPPDTALPAVLRALFPCGSITGAPKHHTMDLIARLEPTPRGLYTGAIGWLDAPDPDRALGDFCWSVAIRTLVLEAGICTDDLILRPATLGLGAGIVLDSVAADELAECRLKGRFLTRLDPGFTLFESLRCEGGQLLRLEAHLARLQRSARALGFVCDLAAVRAHLADALALAIATALPRGPERWRVDLAFDGTVQLQRSPLPADPVEPVRLQWAAQALAPSERWLLQHKTSLRSSYDAAMQAAMAAGAFDRLFLNAEEALTEGARSNVFVKLGGQWFTPPLSAGVLPGVMRAAVLADPAWQARERVLRREELAAAEGWMVCNALRGLLRATAPEVP